MVGDGGERCDAGPGMAKRLCLSTIVRTLDDKPV